MNENIGYKGVKLCPLRPLKSTYKHISYGFDTETYDENKGLLCCILRSDTETLVFKNREDFILWCNLQTKKVSLIATNLLFDLSVMLYRPEFKDFSPEVRILWKNGRVICANFGKVEFLDTLNYFQGSVDALGKIVKIPKMEKPKRLGEFPESQEEWDYLFKYCENDALISLRFFQLLEHGANEAGGKLKISIASSSMDVFRRKFLKGKYRTVSLSRLPIMRKAYYGGRTEAITRGNICIDNKKMYLYDVNSLYPAMMLKDMPNPNYERRKKFGDLWKIKDFDGISTVLIKCPESLNLPLLPFRHGEHKKLVFPVGTFKGVFSHVELRKALDFGYQILSIEEQIYYTHNCNPFIDYVKTFYNKRLQHQVEGSPLEIVDKSFLTNLYGKFGEKVEEREEIVHLSTVKVLPENPNIIGNYLRIKKGVDNDLKMPCHCIPIWAIYVTAYGRIHIHKRALEENAVYMDTDSIIIDHMIPDSKELGEFKLERVLDKCVIVRPKMYYYSSKGEDICKVKGLGRSARTVSLSTFEEILKGNKVYFMKMIKFFESLRRLGDIYPNKPILQPKDFDLEDDKRVWSGVFSAETAQTSKPLCILETPNI